MNTIATLLSSTIIKYATLKVVKGVPHGMCKDLMAFRKA
jgi:hypothetical protein